MREGTRSVKPPRGVAQVSARHATSCSIKDCEHPFERAGKALWNRQLRSGLAGPIQP